MFSPSNQIFTSRVAELLFIFLALTICSSFSSNRIDEEKSLKSLTAWKNILLAYTGRPSDVVFLLDESSSISPNEFGAELKLAESIGKLFRVESNGTRIATLTYASRVRMHFNFFSLTNGTVCNFFDAMKRIKNIGGWSFTNDALRKAMEILSAGRENVEKVVILMSDGKSSEGDPTVIAEAMKSQGVAIFVVGIDGFDEAELSKIASSSSYLYKIPDFDFIHRVIDYLREDRKNDFFIPIEAGQEYSCPKINDCCDMNLLCACAPDATFVYVCKKGYYRKEYHGKCLRCPRGTYNPFVGQEECRACPLNSNTLNDGATSIRDCQCKPGYFGNPANGGFCRARHPRCPRLMAPMNGALIPSNCQNSVGDECSFFCKYPYCPYDGNQPGCAVQLSGKKQENRKCLASGYWSGSVFSCEIGKCPNLQDPDHGFYKCNLNFNINSHCELHCHEGYVKVGGRGDANCLSNGSWQQDNAHCEIVTCNPLNPISGVVTRPNSCILTKQTYQSMCISTCAADDTMLNSPSNPKFKKVWICGAKGIWMAEVHPPLDCADKVDVGPTTCMPNPCKNGGICHLDTNNIATCNCPRTFKGLTCDINANDCSDDFCLNNGVCIIDDNGHSCLCKPGFSGSRCETNINDCVADACINGGTCLDEVGGYRCFCPKGIEGENCEIVPRFCDSNPCQNGGKCINKFMGFHCCCPMGFSGPLCEQTECASMPCLNGATCIDKSPGHVCVCPPGYEGLHCEKDKDDCLSMPCANGATCVDHPNNHSCLCPPGFAGHSCETELTGDFDLTFANADASQHVMFEYDRDLYAVTVSFWMLAWPSKVREIRGTPVSFSYRSPISKLEVTNALTWYDFSSFIIYIHDHKIHTGIEGDRDLLWHHYALTWDSFDGAWVAYKDGVKMASGTRIGLGIPIWKGFIVLGQDQDSVGGSFNPSESFQGKLSQFNVWDFAMSSKSIMDTAQSCGHFGNVFAWPQATDFLSENIEMSRQSQICQDRGNCDSNDNGCYCKPRTRGNSTTCGQFSSSCLPNDCKNQGICQTDQFGLKHCQCLSGFEGKFCEYDINECLQSNGNCTHECVNTHGSSKCRCPSGSYLSTDGQTCIAVRYCHFESLFYTDQQEWVKDCKRCICLKGRVKCTHVSCPNHLSCRPDERVVHLPGKCCKQCSSVAAFCVVGKSNHFTTFDGAQFKLPGMCRYTFIEDCSEGGFTVAIENDQANFKHKKLIVTVMCSVIEVSSKGSVLVDGLEKELPIVESELFSVYSGFAPFLKKNGMPRAGFSNSKNSVVTIVLYQGIIIHWHANNVIRIDAPVTMRKRLCGLCGNFNGHAEDDRLTSSLFPAHSIAEFFLSWRVEQDKFCQSPIFISPGRPNPSISGTCGNSQKKWLAAQELCKPLRSEPFDKCYLAVNSKDYYDLCIQDACSCKQGQLCHCNAIRTYIDICEKINISIGSWTGMETCSLQCQNGMIFNVCGPACPTLCNQKLHDDIRCQIQASCKVGCHCPVHLVLHNGTCIDPSECP